MMCEMNILNKKLNICIIENHAGLNSTKFQTKENKPTIVKCTAFPNDIIDKSPQHDGVRVHPVGFSAFRSICEVSRKVNPNISSKRSSQKAATNTHTHTKSHPFVCLHYFNTYPHTNSFFSLAQATIQFTHAPCNAVQFASRELVDSLQARSVNVWVVFGVGQEMCVHIFTSGAYSTLHDMRSGVSCADSKVILCRT